MPLTNDYKACEILDLDPASKREGPFIVVQSSVEADDPLQAQRLFLLRQDGVWVEYATQALRHPEQRDQLYFQTMTDIINLLESLPPTVRTEQGEIAGSQLNEFKRQMEAAGGPLNFIHADMRQWMSLQHWGA